MKLDDFLKNTPSRVGKFYTHVLKFILIRTTQAIAAYLTHLNFSGSHSRILIYILSVNGGRNRAIAGPEV